MIFFCCLCGKEFKRSGNTKTCSLECAAKQSKKRAKKYNEKVKNSPEKLEAKRKSNREYKKRRRKSDPEWRERQIKHTQNYRYRLIQKQFPIQKES